MIKSKLNIKNDDLKYKLVKLTKNEKKTLNQVIEMISIYWIDEDDKTRSKRNANTK